MGNLLPYGLELLRRAMVQRDPLTWEAVQQCFNETLLRWMRAHPQREIARRLDSEEIWIVSRDQN